MPTYPAPYQLRLANVTSDIIPSANVTYDLGNTTNSWGSLFLAGNTITLGGAEIKTDANTGSIAFVPAITEDNPNPKATVVTANGVSTVETTGGVVSNAGFASASSSQIGGGGGVTAYSTINDLPLANNSAGDMAYVSSTGRLYIHSGTGWYNIALINQSPTITSGSADTYELASNGTSTVITLQANDPEGIPITWSYSVTSGSLTNGGGTTATVTQSNNVFTITPTTNTAHGGEFTLTFSASDGVNIATDISAFSLSFVPDWANAYFLNFIQSSDIGTGDRFGFDVGISGDYIIAGATHEDFYSTDAGAAYIFKRSSSNNYVWNQEAKLVNSNTWLGVSDRENGFNFGNAVDIDGDLAVIGARYNNSILNGTAQIKAGAAYIFVRNGSTWTQETKLVASDFAANDIFGFAVAISGNTVVVGAPQEDTGGDNAGAVYVFTRSASNTWSQQAKLVASDDQAGDQFGYAVDISGDTIVVGAPYEDQLASDAGAIYMFQRTGSSWSQTIKRYASTANTNQLFGLSVAISGNTILAGAPYTHANSTVLNSGAAYIFNRSGSTWTTGTKISPTSPTTNMNFGRSVDVDESTFAAIVGEANSVNIYTKSSNTWSFSTKLSSYTSNSYGYAVAMSGEYIVSGDWLHSPPGYSLAGAMHVFKAG